MRKRHFARILDVPSSGMIPALIVLTAAFLLGGLVGCGLAASVTGGGNDTLAAYIKNYIAAAQAGITQPPELLPLVWEVARWPLLTLLLGFTALGVVGIPVLFAVRGFLFSFAVASFIRMFGAAGGALAFLVFGFTGLLAVPVLFVLGVQGLMASFTLTDQALIKGKRSPLYGRVYFFRCAICTGVLALCVLLEYIAIPALMSTMAGQFIL
jgi:hypothetical protein